MSELAQYLNQLTCVETKIDVWVFNIYIIDHELKDMNFMSWVYKKRTLSQVLNKEVRLEGVKNDSSVKQKGTLFKGFRVGVEPRLTEDFRGLHSS